MRNSLTLTAAALLIAIPGFAFAAGDAGVGNSDSSAGVTGNVHSSPVEPGIGRPVSPPLTGRSSSEIYRDPSLQQNNSPSSREDRRGYDSDDAH